MEKKSGSIPNNQVFCDRKFCCSFSWPLLMSLLSSLSCLFVCSFVFFYHLHDPYVGAFSVTTWLKQKDPKRHPVCLFVCLFVCFSHSIFFGPPGFACHYANRSQGKRASQILKLKKNRFTPPRSQLNLVHWCQTPIGHVELSSEICNCRLQV